MSFHRILKPYLAIANIVGVSLPFCDSYGAVLTDNFESRPVEVGVSATFTGGTTSASTQVGEPDHGGNRRQSAWGAWSAPGNGTVTISTSGSSFDTVLAVYVGNALSSLIPVAQNNDVQVGFPWSRVSFPTKANTTYSFAIDGYPSGLSQGRGTVAVSVSFTSSNQPPSEVGTDAFSGRPSLPSTTAAIGIGDNRNASIEFSEPDRLGNRNQTIWWRWVAPSNGVATFDTLASSFDTALTVYVGNTLDSLSEVAINNNAPNVSQSRLSFRALANQEYQVMVDGAPSGIATGRGNVILNLALVPDSLQGGVPGSDSFDQRRRLSGPIFNGVANNIFYGIDLDEPRHGSSQNNTVWWQWTPTADGPVEIRTYGSDFDTFLAVYTGAGLAGLQLVANNDNAANVKWSSVSFLAQRGVNYQIMVDGKPAGSVGQGNIALEINQRVNNQEVLNIYPAVEIEIPGIVGVTYQIQLSLDSVTWTNLGSPIVGSGQPIQVFESVRGRDHTLYRYIIRP